MSISLLSTKLYIPPLRVEGVTRPRLTEKLLDYIDRPASLIILSGPAGFGKTTLLSEFVARLRQPVAWVSLDEGDNDPIRFWTYLIAACQSIRGGAGDTALALFRMPQPLPAEAVPSILINDLAGLDKPVVLVLDDYHNIQNQSIHTAIHFLLDHLPANVHIVLSTRVDPPWPLARFRARNQLIEIRAQELRFTTEEAAAFLNQTTGLDLSADDIAALEARTEGWAAGLQLAAISMKGRNDITGFIKAFTGSHVYVAEYLVEEVLQRQPEDLQTFLMQTSILERLNAGLCDAVTSTQESQSMLSALRRLNLFILPLDDEGLWFRYHHLFADLLQARLQQKLEPDAIAALHRRASAWYAQRGMTAEAVEHALAVNDYAQALMLVERAALPMTLQGYVRTVEAWLLAIPQKLLERSPRINMAFAWMHLLRANIPLAMPYLERLETHFSTPEPGDGDPSLQGEWLALKSRLLNMQGKPGESCNLSEQALLILPEKDAPVRSMILVNLATAYQQMLDYDRAAETFQLIVQLAQASGDYVSEILGTSGQAQMVLQQGRLHLAYEIALDEINRLEAAGRSTPFSATLYGELGQIHYYWLQLDRARSYFQRSIQTSGQSGFSDPEIYRYVMLSRMFQMEGNWTAAGQEMQKASDLMRRVPPAMIREEVISQQIRVDLALGHLTAAQTALQADGFSFESGFSYPELTSDSGKPVRPVAHPAGLLYNSALRILLFRARMNDDTLNLERGLELASQVLDGELQCQNIPIAIETLLLRGQLYAALGDEPGSLADVARALEMGQPEGFISIFVEEGLSIARALEILLQRNLLGTGKLSYVQDILAAFPQSQVPGETRLRQDAIDAAAVKSTALVEPLSRRELEVLQWIAAGDSNRSIAEKLVITVSAVKKHTANIYGKLDVNSRTQAVARARQLRLLPPDE
ncbi:MAG: hypothetical protein EHM70_14290 [Chloroflexota bacterium]|nr:MAG: hypothetical protein EHM70_14290 [Chloroflexota bacterium]